MFIGHFGVALAAKRLAPRTSLGTLILGAEFLDLLGPIFLLLGIEHMRIAPGITKVTPLDFYDYPISHSLATTIGWSVLVGGIYFLARRYARGAWVVGLAVLSHWALDFLVHRPDLPLWPSGPQVGLGLWNSWAASITVEVLFFAAGLGTYLATTMPKDTIGRYAFWLLMAILFFGWVSTLFAGPPPSVNAFTKGALIMWVTVPWGYWVDSHRAVKLPLPA
ncbi:MAG TPA: hypothetical protein VEV41_17805 [Terriglobales bacterium]|jgi:hypothetical protein|nr:hypothetical protein [Terriglobales bacterium]